MISLGYGLAGLLRAMPVHVRVPARAGEVSTVALCGAFVRHALTDPTPGTRITCRTCRRLATEGEPAMPCSEERSQLLGRATPGYPTSPPARLEPADAAAVAAADATAGGGVLGWLSAAHGRHVAADDAEG